MKQGQSIAIIWQRVLLSQSSRYGRILCWMIGLETVTYNEQSKSRKIKMDNQLNENNMSKEMNWDTFVPTKEIREYDMKLRESIRQREQMKLELAELESRGKDMFYDVEHEMLETGIRYFDVRSEFYVYKVEYEYIKAENEYLSKQTDI